jgi:hypothetical protein
VYSHTDGAIRAPIYEFHCYKRNFSFVISGIISYESYKSRSLGAFRNHETTTRKGNLDVTGYTTLETAAFCIPRQTNVVTTE